MIVLIDNYDSFTFNIYNCIICNGADCQVFLNDKLTIDQLNALKPEGIVISAGPRTPHTAGITMEVIKCFHKTIPILGICLGYQAIGLFFGAKLIRAKQPLHGKLSRIYFRKDHFLFQNLPYPFMAMQYNSLILNNLENTPLVVTAQSHRDEPMAVAHPQYPITGVQFHPESILSECSMQLFANWLRYLKQKLL